MLGFVSAFVLDEATAGDRKAGAERLQALRAFEVLEFVPVITELADDYLAALHLPPASRNDAYHLAMAAWHEMDYLVTWNCRHIASGRVRRIVADINEGREIRSPIICTPEELLDV